MKPSGHLGVLRNFTCRAASLGGPCVPEIGRMNRDTLTPKSLLIVEDNRTDRELLRYLLGERFSSDVTIFEAANLRAAMRCLEQNEVDCVILDLQLPDSAGKATFLELYQLYPDTPLIVMTHNKDRALAIDMIHLGAADYVIKNFTDQEELFRRIVFAIEKHRVSVRMTPEDAGAVHRLDRAHANLRNAHESGQHSAIRETTVETTVALADVSRRMFAEMQNITTQVVRMKAQNEQMGRTVEHLDLELLRGREGRPSMRSQVDLLEHRLGGVERKQQEFSNREDAREETTRRETIELKRDKMSNRTKVLLGILALIGAIAGAAATYEAARSKGTPNTQPSGSAK